MVSLKVLEKRGITKESLRKKLEPFYAGQAPTVALGEDPSTQSEKLAALRERLRSRVQAGRDGNFERYKIYHALDLALDVSFKQVDATLIRAISSKDHKDIQSLCESWSLKMDGMWTESVDPKSKQPIRKLNIPAFFDIFIPICKAYLTIRWAKIMDGLYKTPLMSYVPTLNDEKTRLKCKVIESRVERMSEEYGYFQVWRQCVMQMLHYGICLQFPVEEWHKEEQVDPEAKDGKETYVVKEGIRYHMPHPTRMYIDENHRASTINSDTGCEFAGYWRIVRYKDIRENPGFFNKDKVTLGPTDWWKNNTNFFNTVYSGCTISFPSCERGSGSQDREAKMVNPLYTQAWDDHSVQLSEHWERLIPSQYGLGDYDHPVWFRFAIAGYDTIVYIAPVPYTPPIYWGYDPDENRDMNSSMTLETIAFQDQLTNLLQQHLISTKQNLDNVTFVNTDMVGEDWIEKVESKRSVLHKMRNFFPFSGKKFMRAQVKQDEAFFSHRFPTLNTQEIIQAIRMILDILERVLVMSAQEVGASASHEQSAAEQKFIHSSTSTRLAFTTMGVDQAIEAQKRQAYEGLMEYGQDEFYAELPFARRITPALLKKMGFTWNDDDPISGEGTFVIKTTKKSIDIDTFASVRQSRSKTEDMEKALAISNALATWLGSPLGAAIGPDQAIKIINVIAELAGFPEEFKLENRMPPIPTEELPQILDQLQQKILNEIGNVLKPMAEQDQVQDQKIDAMAQAMAGVAKAVGALSEMVKMSAPAELTGIDPATGQPIPEPGMEGMPQGGMPGGGMMPPPAMPPPGMPMM